MAQLFDWSDAKDADARITRLTRVDPRMPAGLYGDIENGFRRGLGPYSTLYRQTERALPGRPRGDLADTIAMQITQHVKPGKPRDKQKSFWTRVNEFMGDMLGGSEEAKEATTGKKATNRFTDQVLGVLDFVPHIYRAGRYIEMEITGDPTERSDISELGEYFNPRAWGRAWQTTDRREQHFHFEDLIETDLPELSRELAKKAVTGQSGREIADAMGANPEIIDAILGAPKVQKYMQELEKAQLTPGRGLMERLAGWDPMDQTPERAHLFGWETPIAANAHGLATGTIDAFIGLFADPTVVIGKGIKGFRDAGRLFTSAGSLDAVVKAPKMQKVINFAVETDSPAAIMRRYKQIPAPLADALSLTKTPEEATDLIKQAATAGRIIEIPRQGVLAKAGENLLLLEQENRVARLYGRAIRGFRELPRTEVDPNDVSDAYRQASGLMDVFPKVFKEPVKEKMLDRVIRAQTPQQVYKVFNEIVELGGQSLKVPKKVRGEMTRFYDQYWRLRSYNLDTETGSEVSRILGEMGQATVRQFDEAAQAMPTLPHLPTELMNKIPLFSPRELRDLKWGQGSFTKFFALHPRLADAWMIPQHMISTIWKPLTLATRPAWTIRVVGEEQLRIGALGHSLDPKTVVRSVRGTGEYSWVTGPKPARPSFWRHPLQYVQTMPAGVPEEVLVGKSRLFLGERMIGKGSRSTAGKVVVPFENDPYAVHGWHDMLARLLDDPLPRQFLQGKSMAEVEEWLVGPGQKYMRDLVSIGRITSKDEIPRYLDTVVDRIANHIHGNDDIERLLRGISRGEFPRSYLDKRALQAAENPPMFVSRDVSLSNTPTGIWARATEVGFKYLMDIPTNHLSRIRLYRQVAVDTEKRLLAFAEREKVLLPRTGLRERYEAAWTEDMRRSIAAVETRMGKGDPPELLLAEHTRLQAKVGRKPTLPELEEYAAREGYVTRELIRENAKAHAVSETIATLYDPLKRSHVERQLATQFPFIAAFFEIMTTWSRIMALNPHNLPRAAKAMDAMLSPGIEGERARLPAAPVNWLVEKLTGSGTEFESELEGFNMLTQNPYPNVGPFGQLTLSILADFNPDWEATLSAVAGSYGLTYAREQGIAGYAQFGVESMLPAWMREAISATEDPAASLQFGNRMANEFRQIAIEKWGEKNIPWDDARQIKAVMDEARKRTRALSIIAGLAKAVWPGGLQRRYPLEDAVRQYQAVMKTHGQDAADKWLVDKAGPAAHLLVEPLSWSPMPPTKEAFEMYANDPKAREMANKYGSLFWSLQEAGGEFDYSVFRWQHARGVRLGKAPELRMNPRAGRYEPAWLDSAQISEAYTHLDEARKAAEAALDAGEISKQQYRTRMQQVRAMIALDFPAWGIAQERVSNKNVKWSNFHSDMKALADRLPDSESGQGLRHFLEAMAAAQASLQERGLQPYSFDAETAAPVRWRLNQATKAIVKDFPAFQDFYMRHLLWRLDDLAREDSVSRFDVMLELQR